MNDEVVLVISSDNSSVTERVYMDKHIYDAYIADGWKLFALFKAKDGKGVKGAYSNPTGFNDMSKPSSPYSPDSVYGAIPPAHICVVDWDIKKGRKGLESFNRLQSDLGIKIDTVVSSPSGGGHAYLTIPSDVLIKKNNPSYPDIDFIGHGREWVVAGGQKIDGYGEYPFTDELFEYFVSDGTSKDILLSVLEERATFERGNMYGGVDKDEHYMTRPSIDEIRAWLDMLDPNMSYDAGWQNVIMALNSWDLGGAEGLSLAIEWSQQATDYSATDEEIEEKYYECVAEAPEFYKKLVGMVNKKDLNRFRESIANAKSTEELEEIAVQIAKSTVSKHDRSALAEVMIEKDSAKGGDFYGRKRGVYWNKAVQFKLPDPEPDNSVNVYLNGNNYVLQKGGIVTTDLTSQSIGKHLIAHGYPEPKPYIEKAKVIGGVQNKMDYTLEGDYEYSFEKVEVTSPEYLIISRNPISTFDIEPIHDDDIINEFCNEIWNGKIEELVRLIALSIKFNERKLNRLMIVAPSNSGKSEIATHLRFQKITMSRLIKAITGEKGVGAQIINGIRATGLLLIDEANSTLPQEIKDLDKEIHIDQFGSHGTQVLPLLFTVLTSTHKAATRNNSDELYNRFLQVELTEKEMAHNVTEGEFFRKDSLRYTDVITSYLRGIFKDTILGDGTMADLRELQAKYRLPLNNDLDEFIYSVSVKMAAEIRSSARENEHGDYLNRSGEFYVKRKGDVHKLAHDLLSEMSGIDHNKYAERIVSHMVGEMKSIKIDGSPIKYYHLNMSAYMLSEEQMLLEEFDDLELEEL